MQNENIYEDEARPLNTPIEKMILMSLFSTLILMSLMITWENSSTIIDRSLL